ncbi:MAG TPA: glutathione-disulfide reductase [Acetobacteraceae bacterium]|nr:glutathione-disulfide reductase [Acetobacteraceae bacterium]
MSDRFDYDLFVIGGGSGGVRCARIAASHGARVAIAEERHWGGTCVNVGCVPKKLMVMAADYGMAAEDARGFGWHSERGTHDWAAFIAAKDREIARLNAVYVKLLQNAGAQVFDDRAWLVDPHTIEICGRDGASRRVTAERIVIAVGGHPVRLEIPGAAHGIVSDDAFFLPALPKRIVMLGGGYIAVEFAGIFSGLGAEVALVTRQPLPLRGFDHDLRTSLAEALDSQGVRLHRSVSVRCIDKLPDGSKRLHLSDGETIDTDLVFFAVGRVPNTRGLGLERAGVAVDAGGAVLVDEFQTTSQPHIYAIGDVTDRFNLTPVAIAEGHMLAERLFGTHARRWSFDAVPTAVFSHPPLATVGLTEEQAAERGPADIYLTRFTPMRHTMTGRRVRTMMKVVVDPGTDRVLGIHMFGDDAPEIMQGLAVGMTAGMTKADLDQTIGIHPTAAEEFVTLRTRTRVAEVPGARDIAAE